MKTKYKSPKLIFLQSKPKLLQYVDKIKLDLESVISIEQKGTVFLFKGLGFQYQIHTDSDFSFFKSDIAFKEIVCEAG